MDLQSMDEPAMRQWLDSLDRKQLQAEAKLRGVKANSKSSIIVEELLALLLSGCSSCIRPDAQKGQEQHS
jgi:hypothetical protein